MKNPHASLLTRSLLESARQDGPSAESKARIWEQVALAPQLSLVAHSALKAAARQASHSVPPPSVLTSATVAPAVVAGGAFWAGFSAGKLLIAGAIAGSVMTVGLGMFLLRGGPPKSVEPTSLAPTSLAPTSLAPTSLARPSVTRFNGPGGSSRVVDPSTLSAAASSPRASVHSAVETAVAGSVEPKHASTLVARSAGSAAPSAVRVVHARIATSAVGDDVLTREVSLVSEARTELLQGHPGAALDLLDDAARGGSHSLEPEQLSLRVRALRALGRDDEAGKVEETLKKRFPEHFLAR